jgi:acid phosphatase type 7
MPTQIMQEAAAVICCLTFFVGAVTSQATSKRGSDPSKPADQDAVLVGAGDIASCDDLAGADGSDENFAKCYGPTWGRFKDRTRPAPGNHEYNTDGASGYVRYFGAAAGDPTKGYYSYELGG